MGESSTFDSLESIKKDASNAHILIWNNGCTDPIFIQRLSEYSDDVFNCTKNQGLLEAMNYVFLTRQASEYIMLMTAGIQFSEGQVKELLDPFEDEKVGIVAEYQLPIDTLTKWPIECGHGNIPEGIDVYRRSMLDDIGCLCPSFRIWGTAPTELKLRAMNKGWKVMGVRKRARHINIDGQGKEKLGSDTIMNIMFHNNIVMNMILNRDYDYKWWRTNLLDEATDADLNIPTERVLY